MEDLGFEVCLPEPVPDNRLFVASAVKNYLAADRINSINLFDQIRNIFDRFLDFDRSLTDQHTMAELVACYAISTWFIESFNVIGYIWATGERGSGKTQLLLLLCELGFLGQFIQASGSLATLRDLADYGAFLGFDDAEQVSNKNFDPDKRNLLLAGNRRGSQIPLKEPVPNSREWRTRYVNTFCARGFTATNSPDPVLGSRSITVPLVRTANKLKGNADPLDETLWTIKPKEIRGSLWQFALSNLVEVKSYAQNVGTLADLTGRDLDAWRGILAIALFLDAEDNKKELLRHIDNSKGEKTFINLFERMNRISVAYQQERSSLETSDLTKVVLRAITFCLIQESLEQIPEIRIKALEKNYILKTKEITEAARHIVEDEELDFSPDFVNSRRIGRIMAKLRFQTQRQAGTGQRGWLIVVSDLTKTLQSFGLLEKSDISDVSDISDIEQSANLFA